MKINMPGGDNKNSITSRIEWVDTYGDIYENAIHGRSDYPVSIYFIDLKKEGMHYIPWHWHEEMELMFVYNGAVKISTNDVSYIVESGCGVLINQNVMHSVYPEADGKCELHSIIFHPNFIMDSSNTHLQDTYLTPIQGPAKFKFLLLSPGDRWHAQVIELFRNLLVVNTEKPFGYEIATKGYLCQFWFLLLEPLSQTSAPAKTHVYMDEQRVKQAMLFMRQHYTEPLTLDEIAASVHISKSECCRCFARTLHMTPFEYLMKYRIYESTKLLTNKDTQNMSISELGALAGFNNASYFNKIFKKYLHCTPSYYRSHQMQATDGTTESPFQIPEF